MSRPSPRVLPSRRFGARSIGTASPNGRSTWCSEPSRASSLGRSSPWRRWPIAIESGGPVFFRQRASGNRRPTFTMWKLRTMVAGNDDKVHREYVRAMLSGDCSLEAGASGLHKLDDDRITRVGRILRRASIDELPQLLNVLRGEMSLVGPRPCLPWEVELYAPVDRVRFDVKPGMTGLWQVSGRSRLADDPCARARPRLRAASKPAHGSQDPHQDNSCRSRTRRSMTSIGTGPVAAREPLGHQRARTAPASGELVGNSLTGSFWTLVSRGTGLVRIVFVGAILGATYLGNTYQAINALPNLIYYQLLAGSLFVSLLVPPLVARIRTGDTAGVDALVRGFLGCGARDRCCSRRGAHCGLAADPLAPRARRRRRRLGRGATARRVSPRSHVRAADPLLRRCRNRCGGDERLRPVRTRGWGADSREPGDHRDAPARGRLLRRARLAGDDPFERGLAARSRNDCGRRRARSAAVARRATAEDRPAADRGLARPGCLDRAARGSCGARLHRACCVPALRDDHRREPCCRRTSSRSSWR